MLPADMARTEKARTEKARTEKARTEKARTEKDGPAARSEGGNASDPGAFALLDARRRAEATLSVCLPARNEEATVGHIVGTVRRELVERVPLVDEILVLDDGSTDATAAAASDEGARVVDVGSILTEYSAGHGKGAALWKGLYAARGDLVCFIDADIRNFGAHFVTRLLAPLLIDQSVEFTKGFYRRPLHGEPSGGGRVTELMARPLLSYLFPRLADIVQPLAGEYAGRRRALEAVPFAYGWGVEFSLLVDIAAAFGRESIAQVDLGAREHRNRPLDQLGVPALAILATALRRAGLQQVGPEVAELIRFGDDDHELERIAVELRELPPIVNLPEYRAKFGREQSA
jgi:glucosyl-3-phosphoglycerate synthase